VFGYVWPVNARLRPAGILAVVIVLAGEVRIPAVLREEVSAPAGIGHRVAAGQPTALSALDYTTVLNVVVLALTAVLGWRFGRTGSLSMLRAMHHPIATHEPEALGHAHAN